MKIAKKNCNRRPRDTHLVFQFSVNEITFELDFIL